MTSLPTHNYHADRERAHRKMAAETNHRGVEAVHLEIAAYHVREAFKEAAGITQALQVAQAHASPNAV